MAKTMAFPPDFFASGHVALKVKDSFANWDQPALLPTLHLFGQFMTDSQTHLLVRLIGMQVLGYR